MKKKIAMRVVSLALCVVFTGLLFGAPKAKAVVTETAIGTAAVASYFQATGLTMAASAGSTGALITTGVADIAGSYAMATGAASSGSAFLSSLAAGVSISPAGALVLTAAAVVAIGALVAWYISDRGLAVDGDTASESFSDLVFPEPLVYDGYVNKVIFYNSSGDYFCAHSTGSFSWSPSSDMLYTSGSSVRLVVDKLKNGSWLTVHYLGPYSGVYVYFDTSKTKDKCVPVWSNSDIISGGVVHLSASDFSSFANKDTIEVTRTPEFAQPDTELDAESQKQMVIDLGDAAGTTLDTVVEQVPELIAAGTLAPTYEITSTETGEGTLPGEDTDSDDLVYVPMLERIQNAITSLEDTVVDGIMDGLTSLFVPSEAYLEALPEQITDTFEERTGFLTYPFSLLPDFVDRLSESSGDWIIRWPQIVEPFTNTVLFQQGSFNVSSFIRSNGELGKLYELYRLLAKVFMSFGFLGLCYNKYRSVVGDDYGGL